MTDVYRQKTFVILTPPILSALLLDSEKKRDITTGGICARMAKVLNLRLKIKAIYKKVEQI